MLITLDIDNLDIADWLNAAFESYMVANWFRLDKISDDPFLAWLPMTEAGKLFCTDIEENKEFIITRHSIEMGLATMALKYSSHFGNMVAGKGDAITFDVFLQCCVFNDVIYG